MTPHTDRVWLPENLEEQYQEILKLEAQRLGTTVEAVERQALENPTAFRAAEARARRLGLESVEELFGYDRHMVGTSAYPGSECLEPFEVERFVAGELADGRLEHTNRCPACAGLIANVTPSEERRAELAEEVRQIADQLRARVSGPAVVAEPVPGRRSEVEVGAGWRASWRNDALATGVPLGLVVIGWVGYRLFHGGSVAEFLPTFGLALLVGVAVVALMRVARHAKAATWLREIWQTSGASLAIATPLAILFAVILRTDWQQRTQAVQAARTLLEDRVGSLAAASLGEWRARGAYLVIAEPTGAISVSTDLHTANEARYEAITTGLPGKLITDLRMDSGVLYWQRAQAREVSAQLFAGRVTKLGSSKVTIVDSDGTPREFVVSGDWSKLSIDESVVLFTDSDGRQATRALSLGHGAAGRTSAWPAHAPAQVAPSRPATASAAIQRQP